MSISYVIHFFADVHFQAGLCIDGAGSKLPCEPGSTGLLKFLCKQVSVNLICTCSVLLLLSLSGELLMVVMSFFFSRDVVPSLQHRLFVTLPSRDGANACVRMRCGRTGTSLVKN